MGFIEKISEHIKSYENIEKPKQSTTNNNYIDININKEQLKKFYDIFQPNFIGAMSFDWLQDNDNENKPIFKITGHSDKRNVNSYEELLKFCEKHSNKVLFSCYRRLQDNIVDKSDDLVVESNFFFIDVDDEQDGTKIEKFLHDNKIKWQYKVNSGGGLHYYLPHNKYIINDDASRERLKVISTTLRDFLIDNDVVVDKKIIDLSRYTRIWGTYNPKRNKYCELIDEKQLTAEDINTNTEIIFNLTPKNANIIKPIITEVEDCAIVNLLMEENLEKINPDCFMNDVCFKNTASFLKSHGRHLNEAKAIARMQGHNASEIEGWWKKKIEFNCPEMMKHQKQFFPQTMPFTCYKCMLERKSELNYVNDELSAWHELKEQYRTVGKFTINKKYKLRGEVKLSREYKDTLVLGYLYQSKKVSENQGELDATSFNNDKVLFYFDEKFSHKLVTDYEKEHNCKLTFITNVVKSFYIYDFVVEDIKYKLLSENKLDCGEYIIDGMIIKFADKVKVGDEAKVNIINHFFFAHTVSPTMIKYVEWKDVFSDFNYTKEEYEEFLYSKVYNENEIVVSNYPEKFKKLIYGYLFSGKLENFSLHLGLVGVAGCGKTNLTTTLHYKFDETSNLISCSNSTMKAFLPSYADKSYKAGLLFETQIILFGEELFDLFKGDKKDEITSFNTALEGNKVGFGSGFSMKYETIKCKTMWTTNPIDCVNNSFVNTMNYFSLPAMQRFLFFHMNKSFIEFIQNNPRRKLTKQLNVSKKRHISLMHFMLNNNNIKYDEIRLQKIIRDLKSFVPEKLKNLYEIRMQEHHLPLLFTGLVKYRITFEKDASLTAIDKDYFDFETVGRYLVNSWCEENNTILSEDHNRIIQIIPDEGIINETLINQAMKVTQKSEEIVKELIKQLREFDFIENGSVQEGKNRYIFKTEQRRLSPMDFTVK